MSDHDQDTSAELDALAADAETIEGEYLGSEAADQEAADQAQAAASEKVKLAGAISTLLDLVHNGVLAPRKGEHWKMGREEANAHGEAITDVIEKYYPDLQLGPELTLIGLVSMTYGPRLIMDAKIRKARKAEEGAGESGESEEAPKPEPLGDKV